MSYLTQKIHKTLTFLLGSKCTLCQQQPLAEQSPLCTECKKHLQIFYATCIKCGDAIGKDQKICIPCRYTKKQSVFENIIAVYNYRDVRSLMHQMKYSKQIKIAHLLGNILAQKIQENRYHQAIEAIVPIPASPTHLWQRKFDQGFEIAKPISKNTGIPIKNLLTSTAPPNYTKSNKETRIQLKRFKPRKNTPHQAYNHVALVDDITTTGYSAEQACNILKQHYHVKKVSLWCVAKTNLDDSKKPHVVTTQS